MKQYNGYKLEVEDTRVNMLTIFYFRTVEEAFRMYKLLEPVYGDCMKVSAHVIDKKESILK